MTRAYELYNRAQWEWVADRVMKDGYDMTKVAAFLGVHRMTVHRHLQAMGYKPYDSNLLPDLSERRDEFLALGKKD